MLHVEEGVVPPSAAAQPFTWNDHAEVPPGALQRYVLLSVPQVVWPQLTVTGPTKRYTRTTDSGNENTGVFCPDCGVRIYHIPGYADDVLVLKPGTLDDTSWFRPSHFVWMKSAQGWVSVPDGVKTMETQPDTPR